jgi:hypothetical protein
MIHQGSSDESDVFFQNYGRKYDYHPFGFGEAFFCCARGFVVVVFRFDRGFRAAANVRFEFEEQNIV